MQSADWISMLSRIPPEAQDGLCFLTTSGLHINVQAIVAKNAEVLVLRGRIAGSTDAGYTFMIPYDRLVCCYIQRVPKETDVAAWFPEVGKAAESAAAADSAAPAPAARPPIPAPPAPVPGAAPVPGMASLATTSIQTKSGSIPLPGKAAILERLRKRTSNSAQGTVPKPGSAPGTVPKPPLTGPAGPPDK
jgi:hypothetical protein